MKKNGATISTEELDRIFDEGEDISAFLDWEAARRREGELRSVELTLPSWIVRRLDAESEELGVSRDEVVRRWLEERLAGGSKG